MLCKASQGEQGPSHRLASSWVSITLKGMRLSGNFPGLGELCFSLGSRGADSFLALASALSWSC